MSTASITKSIRLSPEESKEVARLSEQTALTEAALMKRWILAGIQAEKLDLAIDAYSHRRVDLRQGAEMAGVAYARFVQELQQRQILVLEEEHFLERLDFLATAFHDPALQAAVRAVAVSQPIGE